jgi:hypothetical protein
LRVYGNLTRKNTTPAIGRDFGIGTDVATGPNGNLYLVSLDLGVIYEIFRRQ